MSKLENHAEQLAAAANIKNIWGGIIYNIKSYGAKGDGATDDISAINEAISAAVANGGGIVYGPPGNYYHSSTITIPAGLSLIGSGYGITKFTKTADVLGIDFKGNELKELTCTSNISDTTDGVRIFVNRCKVERVASISHGGVGFNYERGNLAQFDWVQAVSNGSHGFLCNNLDIDNNAAQFGMMDLRSNGGDGFHIVNDGTVNASLSHRGGLIVAQENAGYGVSIGTRNNVFIIYTENNTTGNLLMDTNAKGNVIQMAEGSSYTDNGSGNEISLGNQGGTYAWATIKQRVFDLEINHKDYAGLMNFKQTGNRLFEFITDGSGADQVVSFVNNRVGYVNIFVVDGYIKSQAYFKNGNNNVLWKQGTGSPEGVVPADVGSYYSRTDGGTGTAFYVKETGTGNTGWVAK